MTEPSYNPRETATLRNIIFSSLATATIATVVSSFQTLHAKSNVFATRPTSIIGKATFTIPSSQYRNHATNRYQYSRNDQWNNYPKNGRIVGHIKSFSCRKSYVLKFSYNIFKTNTTLLTTVMIEISVHTLT